MARILIYLLFLLNLSAVFSQNATQKNFIKELFLNLPVDTNFNAFDSVLHNHRYQEDSLGLETPNYNINAYLSLYKNAKLFSCKCDGIILNREKEQMHIGDTCKPKVEEYILLPLKCYKKRKTKRTYRELNKLAEKQFNVSKSERIESELWGFTGEITYYYESPESKNPILEILYNCRYDMLNWGISIQYNRI